MLLGTAVLTVISASSLEVAAGIKASLSGWMILGAIAFVCVVFFAGVLAWLNSVNVGGR
jgi:hypothetical protein